MPNYRAYPTAARVPNRKQRKSQRKAVFEHNQAQAAVERRVRRASRQKESDDERGK